MIAGCRLHEAARPPEASVPLQRAVLLVGSPSGQEASGFPQAQAPLACWRGWLTLACTAFLSSILFKYWLLNFLYWNLKTKTKLIKGNGNGSLCPS